MCLKSLDPVVDTVGHVEATVDRQGYPVDRSAELGGRRQVGVVVRTNGRPRPVVGVAVVGPIAIRAPVSLVRTSVPRQTR